MSHAGTVVCSSRFLTVLENRNLNDLIYVLVYLGSIYFLVLVLSQRQQ